MEVKAQRVLVVGLGASGQAAARLLAAKGATVIGNDSRDAIEGADALREAGVELALGHHDEALFASVDRIVVSPGVPPLSALKVAEEAGVPIASEVELASWFVKGTVVAITGTNGKSTVTSLIGAMAETLGRPSFVGGNLGKPLTAVVDTPAAEEDGVIVVELSSFQLERVDRFRANVAVLLNVTDDHLDRYDSFAGYAAAKGRIFAGQTRADHALVPAGDELCVSLARAGAATLHRFGGTGEVRVNGQIVDTVSGLQLPVSALRLRGRHNHLNAAAAAAAARLLGVSKDAIAEVLKRFAGLPHRMEHIRDLAGVAYYDDSKATNVGAAVAALSGFRGDAGRVVLIAGGKDKGGSYTPLAEVLGEVGRAVVTLGEAAPLLEDALGDALPVERATDLSDAVARATRLANPGDSVLLAPACSSFDMFRSYAERGDRFQDAVRALEAV
ncbi:MAG: UDP-N-acetylmuramoyl-L-alanine--D-glutamate ligase [Myxococcota bacterium]